MRQQMRSSSFYFYFATECRTGSFGPGCSNRCSTSCAGPDNSCHHISGACKSGCDPGYRGAKCEQSKLLVNFNSCYHITGACKSGCDPGYRGAKCEQSKLLVNFNWYPESLKIFKKTSEVFVIRTVFVQKSLHVIS